MFLEKRHLLIIIDAMPENSTSIKIDDLSDSRISVTFADNDFYTEVKMSKIFLDQSLNVSKIIKDEFYRLKQNFLESK